MNKKAVISLWLAGVLLLSAFMIPTSGSANVRTSSIGGTVTYDGSYDTDHQVLVSAHPNLQDEPVASVHILGPENYILTNLQDGDYYISAFLDIHDRGEGPPQNGEPIGWYDPDNDGTPNKVTVAGGSLSDIDILMKDIDSNFIQGTACYLGGVYGEEGRLEVGLHLEIDQEPVTNQFISLPCDDYMFSNIQTGTYYVSLFYDVNGSRQAPQQGEPFGYYDANSDGVPDPVEFTEGDSITEIGIVLGGIHFVDFSAKGVSDGSSWEDAFTDLQAAFSVAEPGQEIWVAAGIYTPGTEREDSFELQQGVAVYGGFSGTEEYRYQRNWRANTTVLSGEVGNPLLKTDNLYHVITTASTYEAPLDDSTILDGFTITGGYANLDSGDTEKGGGMLNQFGSPTLVNLNFIDNYASNHGGAIATQYNQEPLILTNCTFSGNHTVSNGGAIANLYGKIAVVNSTLVENTGGNGGGIVTIGSTSPPAHTEIYNTILWGNTAPQIGLQNATATVSYSIVQDGYSDGTDIISDDPLFVDADGGDDQYGTWDDDLHLQGTSPAIDAGNDFSVPSDNADSNGNGDTREQVPLDFDSGARFVNTVVDIGADEYFDPQAITDLEIAASQPTLAGEITKFAARAKGGTQITYTWNLGDGNQGDGPLPTHVYTDSGIYTVLLRAENSLGFQESSLDIEVSQSLEVEPGTSQTTDDGTLSIEVPASIAEMVTFTYTPQSSPSLTPGSLQFTGIVFQLAAFDAESNPIIEPDEPFKLTLYYDESALPAGTEEAELQLYRYEGESGDWVALEVLSRDLAADQFTVRLDHLSEFALFTPAPVDPLVADFSGTPTSGDAPLEVQFTNKSTGDYDTCLWDFGDGQTNPDCHPSSHTYQAAGLYTVELTISKGDDTHTETKMDYISVMEAGVNLYLPLILH